MTESEAEAETEAPPAPEPEPAGRPDWRREWRRDWLRDGRTWFTVLVVATVAAIPVMLRDGRHQWFFLDEWSFLVNRGFSHPRTLLVAHNGHWVTAPVIVYRILFRIWGVNTYRPYQLASILSHIGVVLLMWAVMRRLKVRPWIATAVSAAFILFGTGAGNILFGFQITLTGSVACGFAHLLLSDHDGPFDRRDAVGLALGFVGLMCSGVGVAMVAMVGAATLLRRGWRIALFHVVPPAVAYGIWYVSFPSDTPRDNSFSFHTLRFVEEMGRGVFEGFGQNRVVAVALGGLALVGLGWFVRRAQREHTLPSLSVPLALVIGFVGFALVTAIARVEFGGAASGASNRYVYVASALLLPLIAFGVEVLARRQVVLGIAALVLLAVGVPGNVRLLAKQSPFTRGNRDYIEAAAYSPLLQQLPGDTRLRLTVFAPELAPTAGWLRSAAADGRIRRPKDATPQLRLTADLALGVQLKHAGKPRVCPVRAAPRRRHVERGDIIRFSGPILLFAVDGNARSTPIPFTAKSDGRLDIVAGPLDLLITGAAGRPARVC